jgi:hypothetical protein
MNSAIATQCFKWALNLLRFRTLLFSQTSQSSGYVICCSIACITYLCNGLDTDMIWRIQSDDSTGQESKKTTFEQRENMNHAEQIDLHVQKVSDCQSEYTWECCWSYIKRVCKQSMASKIC